MKKDLAACGRIVNKWRRKKETYAPLIADALRIVGSVSYHKQAKK